MSTPEGSDTRKAGPSLDGLSTTATTLNSASKRLNEAVEHLNAALKKLNLGVPTWFRTYASDSEPNEVSETEYIGYYKHKGTWGICLRLELEGLGPETENRIWHFDDAPRDMRIRNSRYLSKMIERLNEDAENKAAEIAKHATDTEELAATISEIAEKSKGRATVLPKGGK